MNENGGASFSFDPRTDKLIGYEVPDFDMFRDEFGEPAETEEVMNTIAAFGEEALRAGFINRILLETFADHFRHTDDGFVTADFTYCDIEDHDGDAKKSNIYVYQQLGGQIDFTDDYGRSIFIGFALFGMYNGVSTLATISARTHGVTKVYGYGYREDDNGQLSLSLMAPESIYQMREFLHISDPSFKASTWDFTPIVTRAKDAYVRKYPMDYQWVSRLMNICHKHYDEGLEPQDAADRAMQEIVDIRA